jgi:hypothetical protein
MLRIASTAIAPLWVVLSVASPARAELFFSLRGGANFTENADPDLEISGQKVAGSSIEFDDSYSFGGRLGYWFDFLPWLGVAGDLSVFSPDDGSSQEESVIPIAPLLMARVPILANEAFPHGRVQPFVGVGPGVFFSDVHTAGAFDSSSVDVGADLHAGLEFLPVRWLGLFIEYRYTWFEGQYDDRVALSSGTVPVPADLEIEFATHHVTGGFAFHF